MEVGEQQEDAAGVEIAEQQYEEVAAMEPGEEQGGEEIATETWEQQEDIATDALAEKEDAVMESLPVEVETDKLRGEREKAPDNAEERVVHEGAGGLGFPGEKTVRVSDGEASRDVVGLDGAGERNGTEGEAEGQAPQEDVEAEGEAVVAGDDAETEVEMVDAAAAAIDDGEGVAEEKQAGTPSSMRIFSCSPPSNLHSVSSLFNQF